MKKIYSLLAVLAISVSSFAQLAYYSTNDLTDMADSATINLDVNVEKFGYIYVTNESSDTEVDLNWRRLSYDFDEDNWDIQFCECATCYTNAFAPLPSEPSSQFACNAMAPGQTVEWKVGVNIGADGSTADAAAMVIQVTDLTFGGVDTLYFLTNPSTVGTNELLVNESDIKLFPQPANNEVNIFVPQVLNGKCEITITNILGQDVAFETIQSDVMTSMDVSSLNKGIYIISVRQNGNLVGTKRMVISE